MTETAARRHGEATALPCLAVTPGEPAGIGGECLIKVWADRAAHPVPPFLTLDDPERLRSVADRLDIAMPVQVISDPVEATAVFATALPVLSHPFAKTVAPGDPDPANAPAVADAIDRAVTLTKQGQVGAVVTNPIHKAVMTAGGFAFPGHTEYLGVLDRPDATPIMMLAAETPNPPLRVVPVTVHMSVRAAVDHLTMDKIIAAGRITAAALRRDFGIATPRLAIAGLNPHAGEDGAMGKEEAAIITPAVTALRAAGIDAQGPLPADTLFHAEARAGYDAALAMYHDQALIPVKTIDFHDGVNVTLGLDFIRTSPDHGTALNIAGSGQARPDSLRAALRLAGRMVVARRAS